MAQHEPHSGQPGQSHETQPDHSHASGTGGGVHGGGVTGVSGAARQAQETTSQVASQVRQAAAPVAEQAQQTASQVVGEARQQAASKAEGQKERAVDALGTFAHAVRQTGQDLRQQDQAMFADYAERAAEQVERAAEFLRGHDTGQLLDETQHFARRNPALFLGASFAVGLLAARFFKSTAPSGYGGAGYQTPGSYYDRPSRAMQSYGQYASGPRYGSPARYDQPSAGYSQPTDATSHPSSGAAQPYGATGGYVSSPPATGQGTMSASDQPHRVGDDDRPSGSDFAGQQPARAGSESSESSTRPGSSSTPGRSE